MHETESVNCTIMELLFPFASWYMSWWKVLNGIGFVSSSVSDVDRYVIVMKLLDSIFNMLSVFIRRWEIRSYFHKFSFVSLWPQGIYFFFSFCSHLEHRATMKRFVSLQFLNVRQSVSLLGRGISPSQGPFLTQTQNKQTSVPLVGLELTIPVFERAKTFHA
jgi:hypothetical protein